MDSLSSPSPNISQTPPPTPKWSEKIIIIIIMADFEKKQSKDHRFWERRIGDGLHLKQI